MQPESYLILIIIIASGLAIGKIKVAGVRLDTSGVLFSALIIGSLGYQVPHDFLDFGLLLFIFTVGMQSGPGFFESFRQNGRKFLILSVLIIAFSATVAVILGKIAHLDSGLTTGLFTGSLTSTPGLAAAIDASGSKLAPIGYGLAYPVGMIGLILLINWLPGIFKVDLEKEKQKYLKSLESEYPKPVTKNYRVENPNLNNKSLGQLHVRDITGGLVSAIQHEDKVFTPDANTQLHTGDVIKFVGSDDSHEKAEILFGKPVDSDIRLSSQYDISWLVVTNKDIVNKKYGELSLTQKYNVRILKIRRSGVEIIPTPASVFKFGDKILVTGPKPAIERLVPLIGNDMKKLSETDFLPIFLGILIGLLLGKIEIPIGDFMTFKLGTTGGALVAGLILSRIGKTGPILWTISASTAQVLRKLGLVLFLAVVGSHAGETAVQTISQYGFKLVIFSAILMVSSVFFGVWFGYKVMKMNFLTLLGLLTGTMTSTPGLAAIEEKTDSNAAAVAYAAVYPFALVLVIIVAQILVKL